MTVSQKKILLVEDSPDDEDLILRSLKKYNIANDVIVARDGAEAIEYFFPKDNIANPSLPAVVLLDLKLPKIDGLEVLRRIRENPQTKLLPVIILTSSDEQRDISESYTLGANSYVRKPVDFKDFSEAVRQLGLYWSLINEAPPQRRI